MNPYDRYPGIDSDHNFPQEVREALANSLEITNMTSGAIEDSLGEYDQVIRDDLNSYKKIDVDAPSRPAKPILSLSYGAVIVRATGEAYAGGAMEPDLDHYRPQVNNNDGKGFVNEGAAVPAPDGSIELYGKPAGDISVRLIAVDESGNASDPGESETITVVPIETAEEVRADWLEAKAVADAALADLQTRTTTARTDLDDARTRLEQAEFTLEPLPGDLADAKTAAEDAADAAIAAEARATEANNRAMTRLANGNFEDGLKYWDVSYGVGPGLTTDSHSGGQAAWFGSNRAVTPESYLPVVEGQIWELQYYYKARNSDGVGQSFYAVFQDQDEVRLNDWATNYDASLTEWKSSGAVRYTVGPDVDAIRPYIGRSSASPMGAEWIVDDVVLRDVTDVVRLELAAQAAKKAGDDAQSKAEFVELQLDGIDGRLGTAEQVLIDAGVEGATNLATLDQRLTSAFQQADTATEAEAIRLAAIDAKDKADAAQAEATRLAAIDATTKAGDAEAEAIRLAAIDAKDKADAAQAEALRLAKLDATAKANTAKSEALADAAVDAQEKADAARDYAKAVSGQAENIIPDPNVRTPMWDFFTGGIVHTEGGPTVGMIEIPAGSNTYSFPLTRELGQAVTSYTEGRVVPVKEGQVWEVEAWYRTTEDYALASANYSGLRLGRDAANTFITRPAGQTEANTEWTQMKARWVVPAGTDGIQLWIFQSHTSGTIWWADFSMKNVTELVAAENALTAAQERADEAHDDAGEAWNHADAAMGAATTAKTDAIAHADGLPKVLHGTSGPSGTAPNGSTWEQHAGPGLATPVVAKWTMVDGSWRSTPIDGKAVSNMDVGYLTAGGAVIAEAVIEKLFLRMLAVNDVFARRMVVSNGNLWPDPEFERGAVLNWEVSSGGIETTSNGTSGIGGYSNALTVRVKAGETYLFSILRSSARGDTGSGSVAMNIETWADGESSRISFSAHAMVGLGEHQIEYTVPDNGVDYLRFGFWAWGSSNLPAGTRVRLAQFSMTRMADTVLIKDGSVTANKVTVTDELITDIFGANRALIEEELIVKGNLISNNAELIGQTLANDLTVTGKTNLANAWAEYFWAEMAVIDKLIVETSAFVSGVNIEDGAITAEKMNFVTDNGVNRLRLDDNGLLLERISGSRPILKLDESGLKTYDPRVAGRVTWTVDPQTGLVTAIGMTAEDINATGTLSFTKNSSKLGIRDGLYGPGLYAEVDGQDVGSVQTGPGGIVMAGPPEPNGYAGGVDVYANFTEMASAMSDALADTSGRVRVTSGLAGDGEVEISHRLGDIALISGWDRKVLAGRSRADLAPVVTQGKWNFIPLRNGWSAFGQGYPGPQYRIEGDLVRLRGVLNGSIATTAMSVLPEEARPMYRQLLNITAWSSQSTPYRLNVGPDGIMSQLGLDSGPAWISLDNITYPLT